ncbi:hypothetical protein K458DRAFT_430260 [Lentithecium fluviatile CBS 122367]|uniref:Aminoglycoside phosphotransferase domain-containing protein n=1 Tax=Lentithecium fluviatile CBS 122367 TaxID=1168545 RepID=A0A6G1J7E7_9PLEO|nr:hypothetical protein K458DRAFT_430260 [Lentithecium fluviatile CBS 122367]
MRDGFQFVGRVPYPPTEPKQLVVASEVATMDYLRSHGIPVPEIYSYSAMPNNPAGTKYIFMELIVGPETIISVFAIPSALLVYKSTMSATVTECTDADPVTALTDGTKKEIAYLSKFGRLLHPYRTRREV